MQFRWRIAPVGAWMRKAYPFYHRLVISEHRENVFYIKIQRRFSQLTVIPDRGAQSSQFTRFPFVNLIGWTNLRLIQAKNGILYHQILAVIFEYPYYLGRITIYIVQSAYNRPLETCQIRKLIAFLITQFWREFSRHDRGIHWLKFQAAELNQKLSIWGIL
jgi:hypothetical protein